MSTRRAIKPRILAALEWLAAGQFGAFGVNPAKAIYAAEILAERFTSVVFQGGRHAVKVQETPRRGEIYITFLLEIGIQPDGLGMCLAIVPQPLLRTGRLTGRLYALGRPDRHKHFFDLPSDEVEVLLKKHAPAMVATARASLSPEELALLALPSA